MNSKDTGVLNKLTSGVSDYYSKSKDITVNSGKSAALWCVLKLLNASKTVETITNARAEGEASEEEPRGPREQLHKCKKSARKKNEIGTTIKAPIQETSEEHTAEETSSKSKATINKDEKDKKPKTKSKQDLNKHQSEKPALKLEKDKVQKVEKQEPKKASKSKNIPTEVLQSGDDPNSPFITVIDKKTVKKVGKERLNEKTDAQANNTLPNPLKHKQHLSNKSTLNQNTQNRGPKPVAEKPFTKKYIDTVDHLSEYTLINSSEKSKTLNTDNVTEVVNNSSPKSLFLPVRESKKVDSSVSYACVVSNKQGQGIEGKQSIVTGTEKEKSHNIDHVSDENKISINSEEIDGYQGVKQKLEIFENLSPVTNTEGPELSRLHKIILNESSGSNKEETFEHFAVTSKKDNKEDSLVFQNIENSEKKLSSAFTRNERSEAINLVNHITRDSQGSPFKTETKVFKIFDSSHVHSTQSSVNTLSDVESDDLSYIPNKFNSIQEYLEKAKSQKLNETSITSSDRNSTSEEANSQLNSLESLEPKKNPLVLERTVEIFGKHNSDRGNDKNSSFEIVETQSKVIESDIHLIEKQFQVEEYYEPDKAIRKITTEPVSVIETSTIIETSPVIEASTIIETYPNLGSSPVIETSTIVTSNTGLTPYVEASTIIESFPLTNTPAVLETSTVIVTSSKTNRPVTFETSTIIEALPPSETQSILEALTIVETPSQSDTSVDVVTSSIVETLPELEPCLSKAISSETSLEDKLVKELLEQAISETIIPVESQVGPPSKKQIEMTPDTQVRVLILNEKEFHKTTLYRLEKNWVLEFRLGPSLLGREVYLYSNYPCEKDGEVGNFDRDMYGFLPWSKDDGCQDSDDTALKAQIQVKIAGSFHYYFTFEDGEPEGTGYFLVDPVLKYGNDEALPLDSIQCQTVISKCLGPLDTWEDKLRVTKESGYNMIHFTPIQELGASNSAYSLSEQHKLNPLFKTKDGKETTFDDVGNFIAKIRKNWKMTSICDIVLNHTANESEWIQTHPEAVYNCENCPYLRPAYLLDAALHWFSLDVKEGLYETKGIPEEITTEEHLNAIRHHLHTSVLAELNIPELFMCDVSKCVSDFLNLARKTSPVPQNKLETRQLELIQDPKYRRLASTVDLKIALDLYNVYRPDCFDEESRLKRCSEEFKAALDLLNAAVIDEVDQQLKEAVDNCISSIRYSRIQHDGPKTKEISLKHPLVNRYFTDYGTPASVKEHEDIMYSENSKFLMAHNGWVMNGDPLTNFAEDGTQTYIRRQLIAWGDSVKLRYGNTPRACPFLWDHMKKYVEETAKIFDGVRLDNCHSTPLVVAEYLLDCARKVKPDLYVVAELFTNSDHTDNIFVNRLGISSLIREAMAAWDSHEEGRLVYRYGGSPVGSFYQPNIRPLVPSIAHALFMDLTHDNPSPIEKRSVFDMLPNTALVNMACCASGSNRGYDELVPHHIHVVDEIREYTEWTTDETKAKNDPRYVSKKSGIVAAKKAINDLHYKLGIEGFSQVYVDQMDPDVVAVTRHSPTTHQSYILVAFTAFSHPHEDADKHQRGIKPLRVEGACDEIILEATLSHSNVQSGGSKYTRSKNFEQNDKYINGYSEYEIKIREHIQVSESDIFEQGNSGTHNVVQLNFKNFKPGSIVIIKVSLPEDMRDSVQDVRNLIRDFSLKKETDLSSVISKMTLADLNRALYRCDQEETDEGNGFDVYYIPNFAPTVYAGLQGFISLLANIRPNNDLGHPMCCNLRDGDWMIDYIWKRLKLDAGTKELGQWIEENTKSLKAIPRYLIPCYWDVIITGTYVLLLEQCYNLMSDFVKNGSTFVRALSHGSVQCGAYIKSADLPELSPNLAEPQPPKRENNEGKYVQSCVSLAAGLPHFSVGYMRNWGRDTFIALRGLFILTGRYQEARFHILAYGQCLRHGLIPNLLDGGRNSRYNCRDAVWWWLYCVKSYTEEAPNGTEILKDKVSRIFPTDDSIAQPAGTVEQPLHDVIQEALTVHFQGLTFRERNAGHQIDEHMTDKGFNNQIGVHPETGFVFGGNDANCGTWMDKMGSSDKAGNRGKPATPRDGSAIELIGLSKSVITWLGNLNSQGHYPHDGVERVHKNGNTTKWTFEEWSTRIQNNFEKFFWINAVPVDGEIRPDLINKRGIYKDCYGASQEWSDYQLRCNFPIAMVVAPELFNPKHAWVALQNAEKYLLGPLGMKTLDPDDWAYHGDYDNSNDSDNFKIANGFNYHQGPEWVWPIGFFLRAKLLFAERNGELEKTLAETKVILSRHYVELQTSSWRGLPELTNHNGAYCKDSSKTQAWSMSCVLEVLEDLQKIERKHVIYRINQSRN